MNILMIAAEVAPFAKVGGLADVVGALPKSLRALGHDVRVAMPCYKMIETDPAYGVQDVLGPFPVAMSPDRIEAAFVKQTVIPAHEGNIPVYLIGSMPSDRGEYDSEATIGLHSGYFQQAIRSQAVYTLEAEPYLFFCHAMLEMLTRLEPGWTPDVLHCNDWHSGLIPAYAREFYGHNPVVKKAASVFTIHNLAYQGNFDRSLWHKTGLPDTYFGVDGLEFYGQWTFLKGGVQFADRVNTVSENYAREIQTPEYGCGLDGLMRSKAQAGKLTGIVNGIDYEEYDPATDPRLPFAFSLDAPAGKAKCKAALQVELGLPVRDDVALMGLVSRLADQKGLDLIHQAAERMLQLPVQFVLLGTGDAFYERYFTDLQACYPAQVYAALKFDTDLAQRIYGSSDLFLMPSRFEPCGLGQMFALRYGSIPIVRATGGLADTIHDFDLELRPNGNGFVFSDYNADTLLATVTRAVVAWQDPVSRQRLVRRALASDFSWARSAQDYIDLYLEAIKAHRSA